MTRPRRLDAGDDLRDRLEIRELVERWVVWRDAGDWGRFRTLWFDDGCMMATWTQGTADEFVAMSRAAAYLQTRIGYDVKPDIPGLRGPEVEALYASGAAWLRSSCSGDSAGAESTPQRGDP